jgi:hypothetical protein
MCVGALGVMNLPLEGDVWLLGDAYVYSGCFLDLTLKCLGSFMTKSTLCLMWRRRLLGSGSFIKKWIILLWMIDCDTCCQCSELL